MARIFKYSNIPAHHCAIVTTVATVTAVTTVTTVTIVTIVS